MEQFFIGNFAFWVSIAVAIVVVIIIFKIAVIVPQEIDVRRYDSLRIQVILIEQLQNDFAGSAST